MDSDLSRSLNFINAGGVCRDCGSCVQICPMHCIQMFTGPEGFRTPRINFHYCVKCGNCSHACPVNPECFHAGDPEPPEYYLGRLRDDSVRAQSASGGVFPALAAAILARGGMVAGTRADGDFGAETVAVETLEELPRFYGVQYTQSHNEDAFLKIAEALNAGREALFCGTPCQVAGLYGFCGGIPENLYTVDLVCHGVAAPPVFREYANALAAARGVKPVRLRFRDKSRGWNPMFVTLDFDSGEPYTANAAKDPLFRFLLMGGLSRRECAKCPYAKLEHRGADLTLGDAWRGKKIRRAWGDNTGISAILVNSERGARLLEIAQELLELEPCKLADVDQERLHGPQEAHPDQERFFNEMKHGGVLKALELYAHPRAWWRKLRDRAIVKLNGWGFDIKP